MIYYILYSRTASASKRKVFKITETECEALHPQTELSSMKSISKCVYQTAGSSRVPLMELQTLKTEGSRYVV